MSNHFSAANLKSPGDDARLDLTDLFVFTAPEGATRVEVPVFVARAEPSAGGPR